MVIQALQHGGGAPSREVAAELRSGEGEPEGRRVASPSARWWWVGAAFLVVALIVRLCPLVRASFTPDADESIVGLMALHMSEGEAPPVFYYGQAYMGAFEPMMVAALFWLFGPSAVALKLVPLLWSLILLPVTALLAGASLSAGQPDGRRPWPRGREVWYVALAVLYVSVPPAGLSEWSSRARGGFIEVVVFCAVALLLGIRWLQAARPTLASTAVLALLCGFGWWTNNQMVFVIAPLGFLGALKCFDSVVREKYLPMMGVRNSLLRLVAYLLVAVTCFLIGGAPYWTYNLTHHWASMGMFKLTESVSGNFGDLVTLALPVLGGARRLWEDKDLFSGASMLLLLSVLLVMWGCFVELRLRKSATPGIRLWHGVVGRESAAELVPLVVLTSYILGALAIFTLSSYGSLAKAPRYLFPLYPAFAVLWAIAARALPRALALLVIGSVLLLNVVSNVARGGLVPGEPLVFKQERVARNHKPLIEWLDAHGFDWVATNYWVGYRLAFETNERIRFVMFRDPFQVRLPEYEVIGRTMPMYEVPYVLFPGQEDMVRPAFERMGYTFEVARVEGYEILYHLKSPPPLASRLIPITADEVTASHGGKSAPSAVDGHLDTRYGSAHPQRPGMEFRVNFREPVLIQEVELDWGAWFSDAARGLSIWCGYPEGGGIEILSNLEYSALRYVGDFLHWPLRFRTRKPRRCQTLLLTQLAGDHVFDWSIAELRVYGPADSTVRGGAVTPETSQ